MIEKIIDFLIKIAEKFEKLICRKEYYVYIPKADKPKFVHKTYTSARREAERLAKITFNFNDIEILQIVKRIKSKKVDNKMR